MAFKLFEALEGLKLKLEYFWYFFLNFRGENTYNIIFQAKKKSHAAEDLRKS